MMFSKPKRLKKQVLRRVLLLAAAITVILITMTFVSATRVNHEDISEHWAEDVLVTSIEYGLIQGYGDRISPDAPISTAQVLAILTRILNATETASLSGLNIYENAWYRDYVARSAHLGLISAHEPMNFLEPARRQDAFYLISEAFALTEAGVDLSILNRFSDSGDIAIDNMQAVASLVDRGSVVGFGGRLNPNDNMTLAEFLTVVNRITQTFSYASDVSGYVRLGTVLRGSADIESARFTAPVWFGTDSADVRLADSVAQDVVLRSHHLNSLVFEGNTSIQRLVLASQSGNVVISPSEDSYSIETLVIADGGGQVRVGGVNTIEITGNGRIVILNDNVDQILVSGRRNFISIESDVEVGKIELLGTASETNLSIRGNVNDITALSRQVRITGRGFVENITHDFPDIVVAVETGNITINYDYGIDGTVINMNIQSVLAIGETLRGEIELVNAPPGLHVELIWYINGEEMRRAFVGTSRAMVGITHDFGNYFGMSTQAEVTAELRYVTRQGELQVISQTVNVEIENHPIEHFAAAVRERVTSHYKGDFTTQWAYENDLTDLEKELWINSGGYTSRTDYLVWINLDYQRVNIFRWEDGQWRIIRTALGASGREPGQRTRTGVTHISGTQELWWWPTYIVRPIVRFWPGTGHAFHSRPLHPTTEEVIDSSIGFPVSLGCIRMYCEDIWFLYNNIPIGTTVVVF
jgi:hypothetical protein